LIILSGKTSTVKNHLEKNVSEIKQQSLLQNALFAQPPRYAKKYYPQNIKYMPAVKFFSCLDFERKSSFCKRLNRLRYCKQYCVIISLNKGG